MPLCYLIGPLAVRRETSRPCDIYANLQTPDGLGLTPEQIAQQKQHEDIIKFMAHWKWYQELHAATNIRKKNIVKLKDLSSIGFVL